MAIAPSNKTALYLSLSAKPGNFGTRFHNYLFNKLNVDAYYMARAVHNINLAIAGLKEFEIKGCAVSMPFKVDAMSLVDKLDDSARDVGALNTILNHDGVLTGYNTDTLAIEQMIKLQKIANSEPVLVLGAGGMSRAVVRAFVKSGFKNVEVMVRTPEKAAPLATDFKVKVIPWTAQISRKRVIINATAIGFKSAAPSLPQELKFICDKTEEVWDMIADPVQTALTRECSGLGLKVIRGVDVTKLQAVAQFTLYTGITPPPDLVAAAFDYATS